MKRKEEPKYYAKIKGSKLLMTYDSFWNYSPHFKAFKIGGKYSENYITRMTKGEWEKVGIDETVANFKE